MKIERLQQLAGVQPLNEKADIRTEQPHHKKVLSKSPEWKKVADEAAKVLDKLGGRYGMKFYVTPAYRGNKKEYEEILHVIHKDVLTNMKMQSQLTKIAKKYGKTVRFVKAGTGLGSKFPTASFGGSYGMNEASTNPDPELKGVPTSWILQPILPEQPSNTFRGKPYKGGNKGRLYMTAFIKVPDSYDLYHSNVLGRMEREHDVAVGKFGIFGDHVGLDDGIGIDKIGGKTYATYTFQVVIYNDSVPKDDLDQITKKIAGKLKGKKKIVKAKEGFPNFGLKP
jgi:hypothetical protein